MTGVNFDMGGGFGNDPMFTFGKAFIFIVFAIIIIGIIYSFVTMANQGIKNSQSPVLSVDAKVVAKRTNTTTHMDNMNDGINTSSSSTWYYATFEVESGDRMEFSIKGNDYGMLAEGDKGKLTFQGTRYLGFERQLG